MDEAERSHETELHAVRLSEPSTIISRIRHSMALRLRDAPKKRTAPASPNMKQNKRAA